MDGHDGLRRRGKHSGDAGAGGGVTQVRGTATTTTEDDGHVQELSCDGTLSRWGHRIQSWFSNVFGKLFCGAFCSTPEVSPADLDRLRPFAEHAAIPFNPDNSQHMQTLADLWNLFTNGEPPPPNAAFVTPRWKDFGFQQSRPDSDFRAVGVFGIHNLLFFADAHPALFKKFVSYPDDSGYPFAIAGLNVSMMLLGILNITNQKTCFQTTHGYNTTSAKKARKAFVTLMLTDARGGRSSSTKQFEQVFGTVYCCAFAVLDRCWWDSKATLLQFNDVLASTKKKMDEILISAKTVEDVCRLSGL